MAKAMHAKAQLSGLLEFARGVVSVPKAGDPFLDYFLNVHNQNRTRQQLTRYRLRKEEQNGIRRFRSERPNCCSAMASETMLLDDLITSATTKSLAIEAIEAAGGKVTDLLVFLNRSQGAAEELMDRYGVRLHAVWDFRDFMLFAVARELINRDQCDRIMRYSEELATYIKRQKQK